MDQEYLDKMARATRIQNQALAILQRARASGIPGEYLRIDKKTFRSYLDEQFFKSRGQSADKVADVIYDTPEYLFKRKFILIDGGDKGGMIIKKAGFAILFRMIACDSSGIYRDGLELINKLKTGWVTDQGSRIDIADKLKNEELLYIDGLSYKHFRAGDKAYYEAGVFMDEILGHRLVNGLTTILSFDSTIRKTDLPEVSDGICGNMLGRFFQADHENLANLMKNEYKVSRIRVKEEK